MLMVLMFSIVDIDGISNQDFNDSQHLPVVPWWLSQGLLAQAI
jgi:hypothetical protein